MTKQIPGLHGVVLVGHGAIPTDYPRESVAKLKALEAKRRATGGEPTSEELELDLHIRRWPRTPETDPYRSGLEALAVHLKTLLNGAPFAIAYNEFCQPTIAEAVEAMIAAGVRVVTVIPSMLTPGGIHSEIDIPTSLQKLRTKHPTVDIRYAWPFDLSQVAAMLAAQLQRFSDSPLSVYSR